jgi:hypothetical protein
MNFTRTIWRHLCSRLLRRQPGPRAGPYHCLVQTSQNRHRLGAPARRVPGSRRRGRLVAHRSMTALVSGPRAVHSKERVLPVEDARMVKTSRAIQYIHCCAQWLGGTRPRPWMGCELPRCCWSLRVMSAPGDCSLTNSTYAPDALLGCAQPWAGMLADTRRKGEKRHYGARQ